VNLFGRGIFSEIREFPKNCQGSFSIDEVGNLISAAHSKFCNCKETLDDSFLDLPGGFQRDVIQNIKNAGFESSISALPKIWIKNRHLSF